MAKTGLSAPVNITWEMTWQCNLRCDHCLSNSGIAAADELSTRECLELVDEFARLKVFQVNIGGGEPFFRRDFLRILEYSHARGVVTCVSTNGMLIDDELARRLADLKLLYLQVSLDGATAEVNDRIRGSGTFRTIIAAVDCLARHGVAFSINTVLTRLNYPQLNDLRRLAAEYAAELRVSRFRPSGRGKNSRPYLAPGKDQLEDFAVWLERHDLVRTGDSFFCLTSEKRRRKGLDMCGAAKMTCCIAPDGSVYPCAFMQEPVFLAGSVRASSFKAIWRQAPVFDQLRSLNVESCQTCTRFEICRGGCPAVAFHTYHDIAMPDPECLINIKSAA